MSRTMKFGSSQPAYDRRRALARLPSWGRCWVARCSSLSSFLLYLCTFNYWDGILVWMFSGIICELWHGRAHGQRNKFFLVFFFCFVVCGLWFKKGERVHGMFNFFVLWLLRRFLLSIYRQVPATSLRLLYIIRKYMHTCIQTTTTPGSRYVCWYVHVYVRTLKTMFGAQSAHGSE